MRSFHSLLLFCCFLCALPLYAAATSLQPALIQQRLEQIYFEETHRVGEETIYCAGPLLDLYRKNGFRPLWTSMQLVAQLGGALIASGDEGLIPADYHLSIINDYLSQANKTYSEAEALNHEIIFSDAMLLLGQHKLHGKVDRRDVKEKPRLAPASPLLTELDAYLTAIAAGSIRETLEKRSPGHPGYMELMEALKQYKNIAAQGGWRPIAEGAGLRPGSRGPAVEVLRQRLIASGDLPQGEGTKAVYDESLRKAVRAFQARHGLEVNGVAGKATIREMNTPVEQRIQQIRANLERMRWILHDMPHTYLLADIASFQLVYTYQGKEAWKSKIMVGKPYNQTPVFRSAVNHLVLNPTWTIPPEMMKKEIIPRLMRDPGYLSRQRMRVHDRKGGEVNPGSINWANYQNTPSPYMIRQDSGEGNALGKIKFLFPNPYHVYLHDTPSKQLFSRNQRALSHGCIRVQSPLELGRLLLANDPGNPVSVKRFDAILASGKTTGITLKEPAPIFLLYITARSRDGQLVFNSDFYARDPALITALNKAPRLLQHEATIPEPGASGEQKTPAEAQEADINARPEEAKKVAPEELGEGVDEAKQQGASKK